MLQVQPNVFKHFVCVALCPHSIATTGQRVIRQTTLPVLTRVPRLRPSRFHLWLILRLNLYFVFNIRSKEKIDGHFDVISFPCFRLEQVTEKTIQTKPKSEEPSEAWQVVYPLKVIL